LIGHEFSAAWIQVSSGSGVNVGQVSNNTDDRLMEKEKKIEGHKGLTSRASRIRLKFIEGSTPKLLSALIHEQRQPPRRVVNHLDIELTPYFFTRHYQSLYIQWIATEIETGGSQPLIIN
jgi:hypothetical protein